MALVNPHPALKVSVPMNPMVDGWMGDDWFHNGAFRQQMMPYMYQQEATRKNEEKWWTSHYDDYDFYMQAGSAGDLGRLMDLNKLDFGKKFLLILPTINSGRIKQWTKFSVLNRWQYR